MKTFDIKDVFSWSNADQAKKYIGKQCYFADSLRYLKDSVNRDINYMLKEVFNNEKDQVQGVFRDVDGDFWGLCLPADKVIEVEEKKWRAFKDIEEFKKETGLGLLSIVRYRYIIENPRIITTTGVGVITDFSTCCGTYYITIGDTSFNLDELFNYEYFADNEWKTFGVADEC